jgi:hypothetical protein
MSLNQRGKYKAALDPRVGLDIGLTICGVQGYTEGLCEI